jgi:hypothetical protein
MPKEEKSKGKMSVSEAGRRGGQKTSETHGKDFYKKLVSKAEVELNRLLLQVKSMSPPKRQQ